MCTEPRDPGVRNRAGAHCTGLQRHPKFAIFQPVAPQGCRRAADRQHLGMSGRIVEAARRIVRHGDHFPRARDHGSNRHFAIISSLARLIQREHHGLG